MKKTNRQRKAPKAKAISQEKAVLPGQKCKDCPEWQAMRQKWRLSELLQKAIEGFESRMNAREFKPTVADFLKLLQMEQELDVTEDRPKEIKVTWVDPAPTSKPEK